MVYVDQRITRASHCKIYLRLLTWLRACSDRIGERAFAGTDAVARRHDWQIVPTRAGLGRRYRDPRFDTLAPCSRCRGLGTPASGDPCLICGGAGRIVLGQAAGTSPRISA
jgi:DnaJ-class molecular chaperone